jgi:F0F1-type ATP synthase membrane subunit c/vacuolar-type H+-ATPase subunit K
MKHLVLFLFLLPVTGFAQTFCFNQQQLKEDLVLQTKLQGLQEISPSAFTNDGAILCFDRKAVAPADEKDFDYFIEWHQRHRSSEAGEIILRNQDQSFRVKFLRGFLIAEVPQLAGLGILLLLPSSISQWPEDPLKDGLKNLKRAYTQPPVWDKDRWWVNAGHPLAGAVYYNLVRSQDATPLQSFLFSTFQSVAWEYGMEAVAEQPSIQDLLSTSTIGALIGEAQHQATLRMAKNGFSRFEKVLVVILNPAYVVNNGFKVKRRTPAPF